MLTLMPMKICVLSDEMTILREWSFEKKSAAQAAKQQSPAKAQPTPQHKPVEQTPPAELKPQVSVLIIFVRGHRPKVYLKTQSQTVLI